ncbi:SSI family serine proteinase inhibitor [Nonomuraea sp. NPDC050786]|uniref:SSI family serine proteinase inhibitor n=1 Tax=Nonomuraea sp. NPDC050786 TaxID=3154840 RepID=UPI0033F25C31
MTLVLTAARGLAVLGLCATPFLAPLPATAADDEPPGAELFITVRPSSGGEYARTLTCDPDGGLHPRPVEACDALREVDGHVEDLDVDPGPCPMIWDPVTVDVAGHWHGEDVSYHRQFSNSCVAERKLGPLV